jgi:hypothetical protein
MMRWAHNLDACAARGIVRDALNGLHEAPGFGQAFHKAGTRAEWASREYVEQTIYSELRMLYKDADPARLRSIAETATEKIFLVETKRGNAAWHEFVPQTLSKAEARVPRDPQLSPNLLNGATAQTQYTINGQRPLAFGSHRGLDLNNGNWHTLLREELAKQGTQKGVYILRDTRTGEIIKVGKSENLVGRMEQYAMGFVSNSHTITAEIYPLNNVSSITQRNVESLLRGAVSGDGWALLGEGIKSRSHLGKNLPTNFTSRYNIGRLP